MFLVFVFIFFIFVFLFLCQFKSILTLLFKTNIKQSSFLLSYCDDLFKHINRRLFSSLGLSIILFIILFLIIFYYLNLSEYYYQLISFLIGCLFVFSFTFTPFYFFKRLFSVISNQCNGFLPEAVLLILKKTHLASFFINSIFLITFILTIYVFGLLAAIGYALGVCFSCFYINSFSRFFHSSTSVSSALLNNHQVSLENNQTNSVSILNICSQYTYNFLAYSSDIFSSLILAFVSTILLSIMYSTNPELFVLYLIVPFAIVGISFFSYIICSFFKFGINSNLKINNYYFKFLLLFIAMSLSLFSLFLFILNILFKFHIFISFKLFGVCLVGLLFSLCVFQINNHYSSIKSKKVINLTKLSEHGSFVSFLKSHLLSFSANSWVFTLMIIFSFISYQLLELYGVSLSILSFMTVYSICLSLSFYSSFCKTNYAFSNDVSKSSICNIHSKNINYSADQSISIGSSFSAISSSLSAISLFISFILYSDLLKNTLEINKFLILGCFIAIISYNLFFKHITKRLLNLILHIKKQAIQQYKEIPHLENNVAKPDVISIINSIFEQSLKVLKFPTFILFLVPFLLFFVFNKYVIFGFLSILILFNSLNSYSWAIMSESLQSGLSLFKQGYFGGTHSKNSQDLFNNYIHVQIYEVVYSGLSSMFTKAAVIVAMILIFLFN